MTILVPLNGYIHTQRNESVKIQNRVHMDLHCPSKVKNHQLPEVKQFKYLGSVLKGDGGVEAEVNSKVYTVWME